jgi:hypothetical protein
MLNFLNGINPEAYAGIAGFVIAAGSAMAAWKFGLKSAAPVEVVNPTDPPAFSATQDLKDLLRVLRRVEAEVEQISAHTDDTRINVRILMDRTKG